jgi:hypothetical protein
VGPYPAKSEKATIHFIVELTSPSTRDKDLDDKVEYYGQARVPTYVILDNRILHGEMRPSWFLYRNTSEGLVRKPIQQNRVKLPFVDLWVSQVDGRLICTLPDGREIPNFEEVMEAEKFEREQKEKERTAKEFERAEKEKERAEKEKERAEKEKERAEKERQKARADALEARLAALEGRPEVRS